MLVAASSIDIRLQQSINLPAIEHQALTVTRRTTIGELLGNTATKAIGEQILGVLAQAFGAKIETDKGDGEAKAGVFDHATVIAMLNDLPIRALTSFSSGAISESVVQGWIDAANNKITSI